MQVEGFLIPFWVTTMTMTSSLTAYASGGVLYTALGDYDDDDDPLDRNPLPHCKHKWRRF